MSKQGARPHDPSAHSAQPREAARCRQGQPDLDIPAPPWDYNPSAWSQRVPIAILAGIALVISAYLALYQWRLIDSAWDPIFGQQTERVLDSNVSRRMHRYMGISDAALGAIAYLGDLLFAALLARPAAGNTAPGWSSYLESM